MFLKEDIEVYVFMSVWNTLHTRAILSAYTLMLLFFIFHRCFYLEKWPRTFIVWTYSVFNTVSNSLLAYFYIILTILWNTRLLLSQIIDSQYDILHYFPKIQNNKWHMDMYDNHTG